jgi:hypothetical protein
MVLTIQNKTFGSAVITIAPDLKDMLLATRQGPEDGDLEPLVESFLEAAGVALRLSCALTPLYLAGQLDDETLSGTIDLAVRSTLGIVG